MDKKSPILNSRGVGLVSVLVASSILSILLMTIADAMMLVTKQRRGELVLDEVEKTVQRLREAIDTEEHCTRALRGPAWDGKIEIVDPIQTDRCLAREGDAGGPNWKFFRIRLEDVIPDPDHPGLYRATLMVDVLRDAAKALGPGRIRRKVADLIVELGEASGSVARCYGSYAKLSGAKGNCLLLGGVWNDREVLGRQCRIPLDDETRHAGGSAGKPTIDGSST